MTTRRTTRPLTSRARELRRQSTFPERLVWGMLRAHRLGGFQFRRQYPVGSFFVDFACSSVRLIVELDGMSHVGTGVQDDCRTAILESAGWEIIRFTNDEVLADRVVVAEAILKIAQELALQRRSKKAFSKSTLMVDGEAPLPASPRGEGEEG